MNEADPFSSILQQIKKDPDSYCLGRWGFVNDESLSVARATYRMLDLTISMGRVRDLAYLAERYGWLEPPKTVAHPVIVHADRVLITVHGKLPSFACHHRDSVEVLREGLKGFGVLGRPEQAYVRLAGFGAFKLIFHRCTPPKIWQVKDASSFSKWASYGRAREVLGEYDLQALSYFVNRDKLDAELNGA